MMSLSFPEWMPLWGQLLVLACGLMFGLAFMMMPFAVFGVKGRLTELSLQVEELQAAVRSLGMRTAATPQGLAAPEGAVVEEIRATPWEAVEKPPVVREVPVFPELRTPRVSDAYEARQAEPPAPVMEPVSVASKRMPWHEEEPERQETAEEILRRQRAPDANQPAYRPDFSREAPARAATLGQSTPRYDDHTGRAEPVLNWPGQPAP